MQYRVLTKSDLWSSARIHRRFLFFIYPEMIAFLPVVEARSLLCSSSQRCRDVQHTSLGEGIVASNRAHTRIMVAGPVLFARVL